MCIICIYRGDCHFPLTMLKLFAVTVAAVTVCWSHTESASLSKCKHTRRRTYKEPQHNKEHTSTTNNTNAITITSNTYTTNDNSNNDDNTNTNHQNINNTKDANNALIT